MLPRSMRLLAGAALLLAACSPTVAPQPTAPPVAARPTEAAQTKPTTAAEAPTSAGLANATAQYYAAAQQEGTLSIYGNGLGPALFDPIKAAFSARFPGITLEGAEQPGSQTREKIITEQGTHNYVADLAFTGFTTQRDLVDAGAVEPYQSPQMAQLVPQFVVPGGNVVPRSASLIGIAINTNLVPPDQEPKAWQDVLDPKWKGKLAVLDPRGSGEGGSIIGGLEMVYGREWSTKLKEQDPVFQKTSGTIWTGLNRGEYAMYLSAKDEDAVAQRKAGAPVKFVKPSDGVAWTYVSMLLIKNAPHPNAAKLFVEWTLSEEGQLAISRQGYASVRQGVKSVEPEAAMDGISFFPRDSTPEADEKLGTDKERTVRWDALFFK